MNTILIIITVCLTALAVILLLILLVRKPSNGGADLDKAMREELRINRDESMQASRSLREEVAASQKTASGAVVSTIGELGRSQKDHLETVTSRVNQMTVSNDQRLEEMRKTIDTQLARLQESNERKLDQMRGIVDEKLQSTLEKRLGESFSMVREQLEAVQRGLGEMQTLANGVGDLSRVLTNVKARGTWGEVQLGAILEQILTPDQYSRNVQTKEGSREMVEFAVKLPGPDDHPGSCVWLPIDAKFPQEDYLRLVEASKIADTAAVNEATAALVKSIKLSAKDINEKYLNPPATTDFAIMFLPTEGLYSEVLRQPGLQEDIQQTQRVVISGPTTLSALLNSLRMGFRTLAIEKQSSEVWQVLAAVKVEFGKFGQVLGKVQKQLHTASNTIEHTQKRTRLMERKLRDVEELPEERAASLLELPDYEAEDDTLADPE